METDNRKYYAAYNERYKTAHAQGVSWSSNVSTPIVMEVIEKYNINRSQRLLEIGCGEGRDARTVLERGFQLTATDISGEAIAYCKQKCRNLQISSGCWTASPVSWTKNSISSLLLRCSICLCRTGTETAFMAFSAAICQMVELH